MKKVKALLDFIRFSVAEKIVFCRNVISKLTGNSAFPTPDVTLESAAALTDELEAAYVASQDGSRTQVSIMHNKEELVNETFRKIANYVDRTANGDEALILSSGFNVSKKSTTYNRPNLSIKNGQLSGSVKLIAKTIEGAKSYIWQYVKDNLPANGDGWTIAGYSTRASFFVEDLDVAGKYWFRVAGITPGGTTDFCNAIMKVVE